MKKVKLKILLLLTILIITTNLNYTVFAENIINQTNTVNNTNSTNTINTESQTNLNIISESAILIDSNSGAVIYSKDADKKMYPASTTKIVTAILAIEKGNLNDITTVSKNAISLIPSGYSTAYLSEGEELSVQELLETLLVHSANDSANVLAEYVSGSIDEFVNLMNQKVQELGCKNTHFTNTNGVHNENHYSTASDLAIIAKYCMQNQVFRRFVGLENCTIPATNKSEQKIFKNTNDSLLKNSKYYRADCIGIKTGYTSEAKNCIISAFKQNDMELIAVLLHSPHLDDRYTDLNTLCDYGYKKLPIIKAQKQKELEEANKKALQQNQINSTQKTSENEKSSLENFVNNDNFLIMLFIVIGVIILILAIIILILNIKISKSENQNNINLLEDSNNNQNNDTNSEYNDENENEEVENDDNKNNNDNNETK